MSELEIIFKNLENFIILIDDFLVPHDNKYGYDSDNGSVLKFKYIEKILSKEKCHYFYPKGKSKFETGYKRGSIYIAGGKKCKALCGSIGDLIKY